VITNVAWYRNKTNINLNSSFGFKINTAETTPPGQYSIVLRILATNAATGMQVQKTFSFPFTVREPAVPITKRPFPPDKPLAGLKQWEQQMLLYGQKHVDKDYIGCCGAYNGPWYYDGGRAFLQMYDYIQHQPFLDFARRLHESYRDYVLAGGSGKLYANFPHGLKMFYERFNDQLAYEALDKMQPDTPGFGPQYHWGAGWRNSREEAYGLNVHLVKESIGFPRVEGRKDLGYEAGETYFDQCLANVLGHLEQWFVSETAKYVYPFMVGLNAEALIDYYEVSGDPEIPYLLKLAADKMYSNDVVGPATWDKTTESFFLNQDTGQNGSMVHGPAPDLNLMIAPLYGWVYRQTGDVKYRDIGDQIFASGVKRAYLDGGKQFTQNFRWSFKYFEWRNRPNVDGPGPTPPPTPAPSLAISANPPSIQQGLGSTLSWTTTNVTSCTASGSWGGSKPTSGSQGVQPASNATYALTCIGSGGTTTRSASIKVSTLSQPTGGPSGNLPSNPDETPSVQLSTSALVVQSGTTVTLSWVSSNTTSCYAWGGWGGSRPVQGSESMRVYSDTRYTLWCLGPSGDTSRTVRVRVNSDAPSNPSTPAPSLNLTASSTRIRSGQSATLSWSSQDTTTCTGSGGWSGLKSVSGRQTVHPSQTTLYVLGCSGPRGGVSRVVQVVVR
jgi:hypothetical protein